MRRISLTAVVLYVITFVSILTLGLHKPVKDNVGAFVLGAGSDTGVLWDALSEVVVGLAGIGPPSCSTRSPNAHYAIVD